MNSYTLLKYCFIPVVSLCALACKKKSNDNPFGNARIATIVQSHAGSVMNYNIFYGASNNVDSMIITGSGTSAGYKGSRRFTYFGSSYSITDESNNSITIYATTTGMIIKVLIQDTISMIYNGSELGELDIWNATTTYPYFFILRRNFTWQNGDIRSDSSGGLPAYSYDYDKSRPGQPGDGWRIDEFLNYGLSYTKTAHLPQDQMYAGTWAEKYYYVFDGSGRISQFTKVGNNNGVAPDDSTIYNYTYY